MDLQLFDKQKNKEKWQKDKGVQENPEQGEHKKLKEAVGGCRFRPSTTLRNDSNEIIIKAILFELI